MFFVSVKQKLASDGVVGSRVVGLVGAMPELIFGNFLVLMGEIGGPLPKERRGKEKRGEGCQAMAPTMMQLF